MLRGGHRGDGRRLGWAPATTAIMGATSRGGNLSGVPVFNYNQSPFSQNRYGSETLSVNDPRRSPNPWRAIAAHVRWEFVLGFVIVLGFFIFVLALDQDKWRIPGTIGLVVTGWVFSLCLHEFAHAATAYLGGDHSDGTCTYLIVQPVALSQSAPQHRVADCVYPARRHCTARRRGLRAARSGAQSCVAERHLARWAADECGLLGSDARWPSNCLS